MIDPATEPNPLLKYPRNAKCFCGSGKKSKVCCLPRASLSVYSSDAKIIREVWPELLAGTRRLEVKARAQA